MTVTEKATTTDNRFVIDTDWEGYEKIADAFEARHVRVTYDRGRLELLTVGPKHEKTRSLVSQLIETLMDEVDIEYKGGGAMTFKRKSLDRGIEPDECYWIHHKPAAAAGAEHDAASHPTPDLVLEIEITCSILDRISIHAAMGVPEVWRYTSRGKLLFLALADGAYREVSRSTLFPWMEGGDLLRHVSGHEPTSNKVRKFRDWIRAHRPQS